VLITRPPFASTDWGAFYFIMNNISDTAVCVSQKRPEGETTVVIQQNGHKEFVTIWVHDTELDVKSIITIPKIEFLAMADFIKKLQ
jgi:hypothetical protein